MLTPEWRGRIDHWRNALQRLCYVKLGEVPLEGFVTREQLSAEEVARREFQPMPPGTPWGAKWEYAWFRGSVTLPDAAQGQWVALVSGAPSGAGWTIDPGGEGRYIINGRDAGGRDWARPYHLLTQAGTAGERFDILVEAYAGHGPTNCGGGPSLDGEETVPEPPDAQRTVPVTSFGIWQEDVYQAWLDLTTLLELRDGLDPDSLRVQEIDAGLREFTLIADPELPRAEALESVRQAHECLQPLLQCANGPTAPTFFCFGHSHIDVAWLWPLRETEAKCARTFSSQLALMEMYPEFKFLQSQAHLYRMTQRLYPELYDRIKEAIKRGQWLVEGGMWVEADTNVSSGESLIRQFIHGKRFYREEFGVESELMWLPDVFGYSGALPQIMAGCGIKYFSTQKIFWVYHGGDLFPYHTFWWEGIDGTRVLSHIHNDYNSQTNPATLMERWKSRVQKDGLTGRMLPFGWGDGGGGATRHHLEYLRRQRDLEGAPKCVSAGPVEYMQHDEASSYPWPTYVGELYFQNHRGTYTTQSKTKRGNRKSEFALREAEMWGAAAAARAAFPYPLAEMDEAWKGVLLNQFHDIIPGSSIHRVYEEAEALYAEVIATAEQHTDAAAKALLREDPAALTVFNSLSWERTALVPLPAGFNAGKITVQQIDGTNYAEAQAPACGWVTLAGAQTAPAVNTLAASPTSLENECLKLTLNEKGEIASLIDKDTGRELAAGPLNSLRLYKDVPVSYDAWDIDSTYKCAPVELPEKAAIEVLGAGPLAAVLRVTRTLHHSPMVQEIWLRRGSRTVEFRTRIDWREKHRMLKVNFPTAIRANEAIHEIQFGHLRRPTHASRPFDADRFEVANQKWSALAEENRGAAVLNDCKYGLNVEGGSINLTLLRSTLAPDMTADLGAQEFTYAFHAWSGPFFDSDLVQAAYELNVPALAVPGMAGEGWLFRVDAPNIIVETVKPAEDGSGDVIVRLYEAKRAATKCTLAASLPTKQVLATNMLEEGGETVPLVNGNIELDFRPFEIKTLRLVL
ncbi:MAG: alpha-mannosidase [Armatimonadota bacterium]